MQHWITDCAHLGHTGRTFPRVIRLLAVMLVALPAVHAGEGEDEWYDPSDWFDGNNFEADDTFEFGIFSYDFAQAAAATGAGDASWGDDYWNPDLYDGGYWERFRWADDFEREPGETDAPLSYISFDRSAEAAKRAGRVRGTIEELGQVRLQRPSGGTGRFTLAKVVLSDGKAVVVNLGRSSQMDLPLRRGALLSAHGRAGTVDGRTVFVAETVTIGDRTVQANPGVRLQPSGNGTWANNPQQTLTGEVDSVVQTPPDSRTGRQHSILNLRLESGQSAAVDLGPAGSIEKIDLDEGDRVVVRGRTTHVGDRQLLIPELLRVEGESVTMAE